MYGVPRKEAGQVVRMTLQRGYHQHQFRAIPLNYSILAKISKAMQVCLILNPMAIGSYFRYSVVGDCPAAKKPSAQRAPLFCGEHATATGRLYRGWIIFKEHQPARNSILLLSVPSQLLYRSPTMELHNLRYLSPFWEKLFVKPPNHSYQLLFYINKLIASLLLIAVE